MWFSNYFYGKKQERKQIKHTGATSRINKWGVVLRRWSLFFIGLALLTGCTASSDNGLTWFESKESAISFGLKEEGLSKEDILGEITTSGEQFIFYKVDNAVGLANIGIKDGQYAWYSGNAHTEVDESSRVEWDTKTYSGKKFWVIAGTTDDDNILVKTSGGTIVPEISNDLGIYYTVVKQK